MIKSVTAALCFLVLVGTPAFAQSGGGHAETGPTHQMNSSAVKKHPLRKHDMSKSGRSDGVTPGDGTKTERMHNGIGMAR